MHCVSCMPIRQCTEMTELKLTLDEIQSPLWLKLRAYLEDRRDDHRMRNDAALGEVETAKIRGRIAEIKEILARAEQATTNTETTDT